jgi:phosphoribosyl 1,2-cyclic phosphodiesterase
LIGLASLGSGSRGNGTLVRFGRSLFLIDCGFTVKQAEARLARLGVNPGEISAILVTHEHADHASGVAALAHKYAIPVYASYGTLSNRQYSLVGSAFDGDVPFTLGDVLINPVRVPHDAREPTQFVLSQADMRIGVLSDLGCVTPHVVEQFSGLDLFMLEANHDVSALESGRYPPLLKRRIRSDLGHLSNGQSAELLGEVAHDDLHVVIGHVSEENNGVDFLDGSFAPHRERVKSFQVATQSTGMPWIMLSRDASTFQPAVEVQPMLAL